MQSGKLITFEGLDGCGKSTQLEKAKKWLTLQGCKVLKTPVSYTHLTLPTTPYV